MSRSPIEELLSAIDRLDADRSMALFAPDARLLAVDGRRAQGADEVHKLLGELVASLRATTHRVTTQWHVDDVWIAEVDASYEFQDFLQLNDLPRAFVLRMAGDRIGDLRVYGAHERPLADADQGAWAGSLWLPPL